MKYMAPEVIKSRKYDTKADIYSLGIIVEELFIFDTKSYANSHLIFRLNALLIKLRKTGRHEMDKKNFDSNF
jgi:serine/threonine protein kinase